MYCVGGRRSELLLYVLQYRHEWRGGRHGSRNRNVVHGGPDRKREAFCKVERMTEDDLVRILTLSLHFLWACIVQSDHWTHVVALN